MTTFAELVDRLQPPRGKRGLAAALEEGRVAAALALAQDDRLAAKTACDRCGVPGFRSRAGTVANSIKQLGLQDVALPERWRVALSAVQHAVTQPAPQGSTPTPLTAATGTLVSSEAAAAAASSSAANTIEPVDDADLEQELPSSGTIAATAEVLTPGKTRIKRDTR